MCWKYFVLQAQLDDDAIRQTLKDRHAGGDFINNVDQGKDQSFHACLFLTTILLYYH